MSDISDDDIRALETEAGAAGDLLMAAICRRALGAAWSGIPLDAGEAATVEAMTRAAARAEVARVIGDCGARKVQS